MRLLATAPTRRPSAIHLDDTDIATLPDRAIRLMTRDELMTLVRSCPEHLRHPGTDSHVGHYDDATLKRMAFLVRRCCQKRLALGHRTGNAGSQPQKGIEDASSHAN